MALIAVKTYAELGASLVLAPERYDPRRERLNEKSGTGAVVLAEVAETVRRTVTPRPDAGEKCLVLDTSDAREGIVFGQRELVGSSQIGSAKKLAEPGDVIVSRLRPYLRQVAFLDNQIWNWSRGIQIALSTEYYVLRSVDARAIAFLVPFLLSKAVQDVLAVSQEGGHHPRFNESTLLGLPIPADVLAARDKLSAEVESSIQAYRRAEIGVADAIRCVEGFLGDGRGRNPTSRKLAASS